MAVKPSKRAVEHIQTWNFNIGYKDRQGERAAREEPARNRSTKGPDEIIAGMRKHWMDEVSLLSLKIAPGIDGHPVKTHFVVKMRTGGPAGIADGGNFLASLDPLSGLNEYLGIMRIIGLITVAVI